MTNRFTLTVPVEFQDKDGGTRTRFSRVGVAFVNTRDNGSEIINIKLDFPVGATELVAFPPKAQEPDDEIPI